jgi:hypothetical protein
MIEASSARELSHSKLLIELKFWFKEDQHQQDIIVQQVLVFVDDELCKVKKPKGVAWPKIPQPKILFYFI